MIKSLQILRLLGLLFITLSTGLIHAQDEESCLPKRPKDHKILVIDKAGIIPPSQEKALNLKLGKFALETSNQILVLTVNDLCGYTPNQFSTMIGDDWEVGQRQEDNGIVLLVKPKTTTSKGKAYIATGKGMEGVLPDILAKRIVNRVMIPFFKKKQLVQGINAGVEDLMLLAKGEYDEEVELADKSLEGFGLFVIFIFLILLVIGVTSYYRVKNYADLNNIPFWTAYNLLNQQAISNSGMPRNRGSRGTYVGGGFPTRGSGGGGGFGGFGGFGGGSFGGGGAGGSW